MDAAEVIAQHTVTLEALGQVLTSVGLSATLILFFVWQAWKREERMSNERQAHEQIMEARETRVVQRLHTVEEFIRVRLVELIQDSTATMAKNTDALRKLTEQINGRQRDKQE